MVVGTDEPGVQGSGWKGGMTVFWRTGVDVTLRNMSKYHIDMEVKGEDGYGWRFTGVYGESHHDQK